jgi:outer membrane protein OmpA-like peptidoglycan-associated protein
MTKRLEAYVNINGCILCFDGVGNIRPAITDNLTEGNEMGTLLANIELDPVSVGTSFELRNIYYSYNKSEIRPDAAQELDKLIITLRDNPGIVIELGAHTDSRGDEAYNLNLSTERAKSAVDYLVAIGGIDNKRVAYRGYGESKLLNDCNSSADCTEDEHAVNRRTELKVLEIKPYVQSELKSLATLKEEEEFQRLLEEIQNQDQVQVGEGQTAPETNPQTAPKLYKEGEPIIEDEPSPELEKQSTTIIEEKFDESPVIEKVVEAAPVVEKVMEEPVLEKVVEAPVIEKVMEEPKIEKVEKVVETETVNQTVMEKEVQATNKIAEASDKADALINGGGGGFISTEDALIGPVKLIPAGYNGYKIQIGAFSKPLEANNPVLVRHGNIYVDRNSKGNFNYMIGDFDSREAADGFLKDIISKQYPDAIIVTYKDGVK